MRKVFGILCIFVAITAFASQREVGSGQTYSTISACITAAAASDICNVHAGTYTENVTVSKAMAVQNNSGDAPIIKGLVDLTASGATIKGFDVSPSTGCSTYLIHGDTLTGILIQSNVVHGCTTGVGIYLRNSTASRIDSNESYGSTVGVELISAHSTDGTYANGVSITTNNVHDNTVDGIEAHAQYLTIAGNTISDNIDTNWAANHPDGIQLLAGTSDGFTSVQHAYIYNNTIRNHTQNIFAEGTMAGQSADTSDVWIFNNVLYDTHTVVNGVDMTTLGGANIIVKWCKDVYVFDNSLGDIGTDGTEIHVEDSYDGSIHIKNNNIENSESYGVYVENATDIASGELDHNSYNITSGKEPVIWGTTFYASVAAFHAAVPTMEAAGISGDPLVNAFPTPTVSAGSPLIGHGANLSGLGVALVDSDKNGVARIFWDIGAYQYVAPSTPVLAIRKAIVM